MEIFERTTNTTLDLLTTRAEANQPCDIQDLLSRFTLDTASGFLFGMCFDTLSRPLSQPGHVKLGAKGAISLSGNEFDAFTEAFEETAVIITRRGTIGETWPLLELFKDKAEPHIKVIQQWLDPVVDRTLREKEAAKKVGITSSPEDTDFLSYLASTTDGTHMRTTCTFLFSQ